MIQYFFDTQTSLWTICTCSDWLNPVLQIIFFNDEKFNGISPIPLIDDIVEKQISVERFFITNNQRTLLFEYVDLNSMKVISHETLCLTRCYTNEYDSIIQTYQENNSSLISINEKRVLEKIVVDIFGFANCVNKFLRELEDLFKKHRRRHYPFTQLTPTEVNILEFDEWNV